MGKRKKLPNHYGTVERRGGGWLARWYIFDEHGNRRRKSRMLETTGGREDAYAELKTLTERDGLVTREKLKERTEKELKTIRERIAELDEEQQAMPLDEMFEAFRVSPRRKQKAGEAMLDHYAGQFAQFADWVKSNHPDVTEARHVTVEIADEFMVHLAATVSANTYNKYLALLRSVWRVAGEAARCTVNPWGMERKSVDVNRREILTEAEIAAIFKAVDEDPEMRLLLALGIFTGLRFADCCTLTWDKIDMARGVIVTVPRKTAKIQMVVAIPIVTQFKAMLDEVPQGRRKGYVVPGIAAEYQRGTGNLSKRIRMKFKEAGLVTQVKVDGHAHAVPLRTFHSLRHSFVSIAGNAGVPLELVKSIVGHVDREMTARYFHANDEALHRAMGSFPTLGIGAAATPSEAVSSEAVSSEAVSSEAVSSEAVSSTARGARLDALRNAIGDIVANGDAGEIDEAVKILGAKIEELRARSIDISASARRRTEGAKNGPRSARRVSGG